MSPSEVQSGVSVCMYDCVYGAIISLRSPLVLKLTTGGKNNWCSFNAFSRTSQDEHVLRSAMEVKKEKKKEVIERKGSRFFKGRRRRRKKCSLWRLLRLPKINIF